MRGMHKGLRRSASTPAEPAYRTADASDSPTNKINSRFNGLLDLPVRAGHGYGMRHALQHRIGNSKGGSHTGNRVKYLNFAGSSLFRHRSEGAGLRFAVVTLANRCVKRRHLQRHIGRIVRQTVPHEHVSDRRIRLVQGVDDLFGVLPDRSGLYKSSECITNSLVELRDAHQVDDDCVEQGGEAADKPNQRLECRLATGPRRGDVDGGTKVGHSRTILNRRMAGRYRVQPRRLAGLLLSQLPIRG